MNKMLIGLITNEEGKATGTVIYNFATSQREFCELSAAYSCYNVLKERYCLESDAEELHRCKLMYGEAIDFMTVDGTLLGYPVYDAEQNVQRNKALVIIAEVVDEAYAVIDVTGNVFKVAKQEMLGWSEQYSIANYNKFAVMCKGFRLYPYIDYTDNEAMQQLQKQLRVLESKIDMLGMSEDKKAETLCRYLSGKPEIMTGKFIVKKEHGEIKILRVSDYDYYQEAYASDRFGILAQEYINDRNLVTTAYYSFVVPRVTIVHYDSNIPRSRVAVFSEGTQHISTRNRYDINRITSGLRFIMEFAITPNKLYDLPEFLFPDYNSIWQYGLPQLNVHRKYVLPSTLESGTLRASKMTGLKPYQEYFKIKGSRFFDNSNVSAEAVLNMWVVPDNLAKYKNLIEGK